MSAFLYGVALQWKLDLRSKSLLITCYVVPLVFFAVMGGIFTSVNPESKATLLQSITVMGVSMGALIGLPPSLVEVYGSGIKKVYHANGVPLSLGLLSMQLSAFLHLLILSGILYLAAPIAFGAAPPENPLAYVGALASLIVVSLGVGGVLGLSVKNQEKLTMISQLVFLPSIMLSGIQFPMELLPRPLAILGELLPATWGYRLMLSGFSPGLLWPLAGVLAAAALTCGLLLKRLKSE